MFAAITQSATSNRHHQQAAHHMVELVSPADAMMEPGQMFRLVQDGHIRLHIIVYLQAELPWQLMSVCRFCGLDIKATCDACSFQQPEITIRGTANVGKACIEGCRHQGVCVCLGRTTGFVHEWMNASDQACGGSLLQQECKL